MYANTDSLNNTSVNYYENYHETIAPCYITILYNFFGFLTTIYFLTEITYLDKQANMLYRQSWRDRNTSRMHKASLARPGLS